MLRRLQIVLVLNMVVWLILTVVVGVGKVEELKE